jgi:hypothetical protein
MAQSEQSIVFEQSPSMRGTMKPVEGAKVIAADTAIDVFVQGRGYGANLQFLRIQNVGVGVVKVAINDTATAKVYNFILAVDTGAEAGNGGVVEIPGSWNVIKVSAYSLAGSSIAVTLVVTSLGVRVIN